MTREEAMTELNRLLEFGERCAPPMPCDMVAAVEYALRVLRLEEAMDRAAEATRPSRPPAIYKEYWT